MLPEFSLTEWYDISTGRLRGNRPVVERRLVDLQGCFADEGEYAALLSRENPLLYTVTAVDHSEGVGDLHYGLGVLHPGKVGSEYFMTKGHLHSWREAAEVYIGLSGRGVMLLEDEAAGESRLEPLEANSIVYVPGRTAHRTMNVGDKPLVYLGVYPARAGHDYGAIAKSNFRMIVVEQDGRPVMMARDNSL